MITYREDKVRTLDELVAEFSVEEATMRLSQDLEESRSENHEMRDFRKKISLGKLSD